MKEHIEKEIYRVIEKDKELLDLYNNDAHFHTAVIQTTMSERSLEESLIFIMKVGYKVKNEINNNFINHVQKCGMRSIEQ